MAQEQFKENTQVSASTTVATGNFASAIVSGNTLVVFTRVTETTVSGDGSVSLADTQGNTFSQIAYLRAGEHHFWMHEAPITIGGTDSITATITVTTTIVNSGILGIEESGVSASEDSATNSQVAPGLGTDVITSTAITEAGSAVIYGATVTRAVSAGTYSAGTGFSTVTGWFDTGSGDRGYSVRGEFGAGSQAALFSLSGSGGSNGYDTIGASFPVAAGATPPFTSPTVYGD